MITQFEVYTGTGYISGMLDLISRVHTSDCWIRIYCILKLIMKRNWMTCYDL